MRLLRGMDAGGALAKLIPEECNMFFLLPIC